jgi:hypothetical protein
MVCSTVTAGRGAMLTCRALGLVQGHKTLTGRAGQAASAIAATQSLRRRA